MYRTGRGCEFRDDKREEGEGISLCIREKVDKYRCVEERKDEYRCVERRGRMNTGV